MNITKFMCYLIGGVYIVQKF